MPNPMWGWVNYAVSGTVTASHAETTMPATNVQTVNGTSSEAWQTPPGILTPTLFIDAGASVPWHVLALFRTNLNAAAQVRWRLSDNSDMSDPILDTGNISAGVVPGIGQSVLVLSFPITTRYASCEVRNSSNADGFINVPLVFAGPVWTMDGGISYRSQIGYEEIADDYETRGGQEDRVLRGLRRVWQVDLPALRSAELWPSVLEMDRVSRDGRNVLFVPNLTNAGGNEREAVFGRLRPNGLAGFLSFDRRTWSAKISERL